MKREWEQPILTANGTIGQSEFAVASGGGAESDAYKAFDSSASSYCNKMNSGAWLQFYSQYELTITDILIISGGSLPSQGIFQVSYDDGSTWTQVGTWTDNDGLGESAHVVFNDGSVSGHYFRFLSQGRSLAKPNNNADFRNVVITATYNPAEYLKAYLSFDSSSTEDLCGNSWTANGNVTIGTYGAINGKALQLDGASCIQRNGIITLGGKDFTISGWVTMNSSTTGWGTLFEATTSKGTPQRVEITRYNAADTLRIYANEMWGFYQDVNIPVNTHFHLELDYQHSASKLRIFVDGVLAATVNKSLTAKNFVAITLGQGTSDKNYWQGTIDEFQIYDGIALHTANFTKPTDEDYTDLKFALGETTVPLTLNFDVERKINNTTFNPVINLKAYLPFDESTTDDKCGNLWTATGNVSLSTVIKKIGAASIHLPNGAYLTANGIIDLNVDKWTFDCWAYLVSSSSDEGYFALSAKTNDARYGIINANDGIWIATTGGGSWQAKNSSITFPSVKNQWVHLAIVKNGSTVIFYQDGVSVWSFTTSALDNSGAFILGGNYYGYNTDIYFDEVRFVEGEALWTENFDVPKPIDYVDLGIDLFNQSALVLYVDVVRQNIGGIVEYVFDSSRTLTNAIYHPSFNGLKAYLPFDNSVTEDLCGNTWTIYGNPTISTNRAFNFNALQLDGLSYLKLAGIELGGRDFCIDCWVNVDPSTPYFGYVLSIVNPNTGYPFVLIRKSSSDATKLEFFINSYADVSQDSGYRMVSTINSIGSRVHVKLLYILSSNVVWLFINDKSAKKLNDCPQYNRQTFDIYVGANSSGGYGLIGTIDELRIYDGTYLASGYDNPPTFADYIPIKFAYYGYAKISFDFDVKRSIQTFDSIKEYWKYLKVWLPFDNSVTEDLCGNIWSVSGNPTISSTNAISNNALQLDGSSYLLLNNIELGGQDFTIDAYVNMSSSSGSSANIFYIQDNNGFLTSVCRNSSYFRMWYNTDSNTSGWNGYNPSTSVSNINKRVHIELIYYYSARRMLLYIDGVQVLSRSSVPRYIRKNFRVYIGTTSFIGSIDEFRIFDGIALHNTSFTTPPRAGDYELFQRYHFVTVVSDAARKINNFIEVLYDVRRLFKWRYENTGIADLLSISGTTLNDLPATQSKTGTAFYQTQRAKCFDLPATPEIWIKFDVYFDGTNRWRAYNGGNNGTTGATAQTNGEFNVWVNDADNGATSNVCKKNTLQTVLLHMVSGSSAGVVEAWVDGTKIYTYTGDVNHGQDFADIYLQSDGSGTFFSNVIISNYEIGLEETLDGRSVVILFDVEISIGRLLSLYLDVKCIVITRDTIDQLSKFASALKVWLPFDTSPVVDFCSNGNEWIAYGNPTIQNKELVLNDGASHLIMYSPLVITREQTFTVGCWFSITSKSFRFEFPLWRLENGDNEYALYINNDDTLEWQDGTLRPSVTLSGVVDGKKHYLEAVFDSGTSLIITIDGVRVAVITGKSPSYLPNYWLDSSITTLDYKVYVGDTPLVTGRYEFNVTIDEFQIYDGVALHSENFMPPIEASYTVLYSKILENPINVPIDVMRLVKDDTVLKVYLTFDEDVTTDECGNEWTVYGHPTISEEHAIKGKALQLNGEEIEGESYLKCNSTFTIEEMQPFTIDCWIYAAKAGQLDYVNPPWSLGDGNIVFEIDNNAFADIDKQVYHCAMVSDGIHVYQFIDGTLISRVSLVEDADVRRRYAIQNAELYIGCNSELLGVDLNESLFVGTIDEFRLIIGDALWTEPFTPSITGEILDWTHEVVLSCDVMRIVNNVEEPWIYYNIGVANGLPVEVSSKINLPVNISRTGYAIYGNKIRFPVPVTCNFWIRLDFSRQGSTSNYCSKHKSKTYGVICSINNGATSSLNIVCGSYYGPGVEINMFDNQLRAVLYSLLLHIKSGLTDGVVEAWVDKTRYGDVNYLIERYVGDVNDGVPIYNFYISGMDYISNIIISNEPITFDSTIPETHIIELVLDVERQLTSKFVTYNLDIIRNVISPIIIPFSGENIEYTLNRIRICSIPQKFILPKISKFYICGDLVGKVHIYSDTNVEGIINGSYYFAKNSIQSEFIESNEFYIVLDTSIISAQDVIKSFIHKLVTNRLIGTPALNRAVIYATDGRYVSWNDFINQFLNCLNSMDYKRFLDFYCDIILDNNDTGAILGWDAGGVAVRTAINVVTESSSTNTWKIPNPGSSVMISNLLVHFPQNGVSGNLTNLEKYILSGLNSEWIYRSLELIKYSFGISFEDSDITYEMYIRFSHDSSSGNLAYTSAGENDTSCILTINMYYYNSMDITDVNGLSERANLYLDRTIVHELVHAVMELISYAHGALPEYIIEGLAELVHGIDDFRKNNIVELLTTRKNDLISALTSEQYAYPEDAYSAGYILLRFLAKQGQHINNTSSNKLIINNLLVVNDLSLVIKTVECDVTTVIDNYVITQCDVATVINNYVITQCDVAINHYMMIEYVLDVYCECVVSVIEFISVQINMICSCTISADVFRRIIGLNVTKFNIMMYGVSNVHMNSVTFNVVMYGVSSSISSSIKFVVVDPAKTRTKLHQCIKPVVMLMLKPINNTMIADQVSDLALRSTPLYPDRSNKGYNTRG